MRRSNIAICVGILGLAVWLASASAGRAEAPYCDHCGRPVAHCEYVCQVVCEMRKETRTAWSVQYQDVCPLWPSCLLHCCGDRCPAPVCGTPKCVQKLVRVTYEVEVPVYRCVVQHLCAECAGGLPAAPGGCGSAGCGVVAPITMPAMPMQENGVGPTPAPAPPVPSVVPPPPRPLP